MLVYQEMDKLIWLQRRQLIRPPSDLNPNVNRYILNKWQEEWDVYKQTNVSKKAFGALECFTHKIYKEM